jgi:hypothetical protein
MERFVRRENVKHFRELLKTAKTEAERQQILKLLAEEQQKQKDAGDKIEEAHHEIVGRPARFPGLGGYVVSPMGITLRINPGFSLVGIGLLL